MLMSPFKHEMPEKSSFCFIKQTGIFCNHATVRFCEIGNTSFLNFLKSLLFSSLIQEIQTEPQSLGKLSCNGTDRMENNAPMFTLKYKKTQRNMHLENNFSHTIR